VIAIVHFRLIAATQSLGIAVTGYCYLRERVPIIGVPEAYIALFEAQICDIGTRSIPKLIPSHDLTNPSPQNFRTKTFFDFLHELRVADSNTLRPLTIMNVVAVRQ